MSSYFLQGKCFRPSLALALTRYSRPENIGEGFHRLYMSNDFKTADAELTERINHVARELDAIALELARRAGHVSVRHKRSRVNTTGESSRANATGEPARGEDTRPRDIPSAQPTRGDAAPSNAAGTPSTTTVTHHVPATAIAETPNQPTPWISQNEMTIVVHLLRSVIQLLLLIID